MDAFRRGPFEFPVRDHGPAAGPIAILLHGFPQTGSCWDRVTPTLAQAGIRCLAPDQRGYAPGARPRGRWPYRIDELVADLAALVDASGAGRAHLVGHDWGALVAWSFAARHPSRVASLTALSVPHPGAFARAVCTGRQAVASWYIGAVQLPAVPEWYLRSDGGRRFATLLRRSGQTCDRAERDVTTMLLGALTPALNWYRAIPFALSRPHTQQVRAPTLFVWSDGDRTVLRSAATRCARYVTGPYRLEVLRGVSHWIPDEAPDEVARLVVAHVERQR